MVWQLTRIAALFARRFFGEMSPNFRFYSFHLETETVHRNPIVAMKSIKIRLLRRHVGRILKNKRLYTPDSLFLFRLLSGVIRLSFGFFVGIFDFFGYKNDLFSLYVSF